ncbi:MAG: helix-turn-helix transcriptional regulator [Promethearchaeia archaeon]
MWLTKFLDMEDDIKELAKKAASDVKVEIFEKMKSKLTPLEFTILESIYNSEKVSGYDLIKNLNEHFAGTWKAKSGTVYPILSKLKKGGFLKTEKVKSPVGPIKSLYSLTKTGKELVQKKVNQNFTDQLGFLKNFLIELTTIYIESEEDSEEQRREKIHEIFKTLDNLIEEIKKKIPENFEFKRRCTECGAEITRFDSQFCPVCGAEIETETNHNE